MTHSQIPSSGVALTRWLAVGSLVGLIVLGLAWEMWLAPLRPGGSVLALKVLPLVVPLAGLLKNRKQPANKVEKKPISNTVNCPPRLLTTASPQE